MRWISTAMRVKEKLMQLEDSTEVKVYGSPGCYHTIRAYTPEV